MKWLKENRGLSFADYSELWGWSVKRLPDFWSSISDYFGVEFHKKYTRVLSSRKMPGAKWFIGSTLNYAEHVFRSAQATHDAIIEASEAGDTVTISGQDLREKTGALTASLSDLGVRRGDRVAGYLSNTWEAVVAFLACASLGAIWSSCSPDFGAPSVLDRFKQIEPKILIATDGYRYNGREFDRTRVIEEVSGQLKSIQNVLLVHRLGTTLRRQRVEVLEWNDLTSKRVKTRFERVPFDHPLWILYSSGTTGLPKPIVHSQGGILVEHVKVLSLHNDLGPNDRFFWFTSTGWMMWNYLVSGLLLGSTVVLYDGSPSYPDMEALWGFTERLGITFFGTSAAYLLSCIKAGIRPHDAQDLTSLRGIGSTGSPLPPEAFRWVYRNIKEDVWLASISGGTDVCTAWVGGCPLLPVVAGEIQCICLGAKIEAFDEKGHAVIGQVGELVVTEPMPSMPIFFWNDKKFERYRETYFEAYPDVWRHGDWIKITDRGSCVIYGRSDATIKRMGVRLGTSEIYKAVEALTEIDDSLVIDMEGLEGKSMMLLFVVPKEGHRLDESLRKRIMQKIRLDISPRYAPDRIYQVAAIPHTINGKKLEVPIKRILFGEEKNKVLNIDSVSNPRSIDFFSKLAIEMRSAKD
jgi:acetoacetyl-CoA synthetase